MTPRRPGAGSSVVLASTAAGGGRRRGRGRPSVSSRASIEEHAIRLFIEQDGGGIADAVPLRRMAEPDEVSSLVLFLASDDSSSISGMEHVIDGALTAS